MLQKRLDEHAGHRADQMEISESEKVQKPSCLGLTLYSFDPVTQSCSRPLGLFDRKMC